MPSLSCLAAVKPDSNPGRLPFLAVADFDGDQEDDVATGGRMGDSYGGYFYHVTIGLSGSRRSSSITVFDRRSIGLIVSPFDVDGDHDLDLIITSLPFYQPIGVWINDGSGKFERGELDDHSLFAWLRTRSVRPIHVPSADELLNTNEPRALHFTIFARAQIPDPDGHDVVSAFRVTPSSHDLALPGFPRAPPTSL